MKGCFCNEHFRRNHVSSLQKKTAMKATWNNQTIAESNDTVVVENNHYFPKSSVKKDFLQDSKTTSNCPWKGVAS